jgi:hypothetical protein
VWKGKERLLPEPSWPNGISKPMTLAEARSVIHSINAVERIKQEEIARSKGNLRLASEKRIQSAYLPADVVSLTFLKKVDA